MQIKNKNIVVTGGASGIGLAMARRFKQEGVRGLVLADLSGEKVAAAAQQLECLGIPCDVAHESDIRKLISTAEQHFGPVDLFCSNAGIAIWDPDPENAASASNADFERCWQVHVMAHVYAARALLPGMIARRGGYFLNTVSAAGLLSQIGSATYSASKHAAIGFAEHLAIAHREHGIKVSVLCPQAVRTAMIDDAPENCSASVDGIISPEEVADAVVRGLETEEFLILPHPVVAEYMRRKSADYDRWIGGMDRLRRKLLGAISGNAGG
jgi:NAD(P)-dependent dehydrogenase (short-subunit alcohol dehydrogenase family)